MREFNGGLYLYPMFLLPTSILISIIRVIGFSISCETGILFSFIVWLASLALLQLLLPI